MRNVKTDTIQKIQQFNQFYVGLTKIISKNSPGAAYSVTEARILSELVIKGDCIANDFSNSLHIAKSYISQILKSFEQNGLIRKSVFSCDKRSSVISLTDTGRRVGTELIEMANRNIAVLIEHLSEEECNKVCGAMDTITYFFAGRKN